MRMSGFRIGRFFGIDIHINWSWLLITILITWNLSSVFGQVHPNWGVELRWGTAILAALLFFGSVLAHELAHSLVARTQGVPVRRITMFLFGGVSNIERHPSTPQAEFLITIVGPLTSLILGGLFTWASGVSAAPLTSTMQNPSEMLAGLGPLPTLLLWLGPINIILGVFNLIPGFPLDGGRVLRSILWAATDNLRRATRWASWVGQGTAWLMILGGVSMIFGVRIPFFGTGFVSGLWLAFIGWFLNSASVQSYQQVVIQDVLEGIPVSRMMRSDAPTVGPDITVSSLVHEHVMRSDDHAFPVLQDGDLAGIVTLDDVRSISRSAWDSTHVSQIMTPSHELITVETEEDASDAMQKLMRRDFRQLPVLRQGQLVGLLRRRDIVRWLQLQSEEALG